MLCFGRNYKVVDDGLTVDFPKAFDKVLHQRLSLKLKAHSIDDYVINWVENKWLTPTERRQGFQNGNYF